MTHADLGQVRHMHPGVHKMGWVKALLLLSCIALGCADLLTTNVILENGMSEASVHAVASDIAR